MIIEDEETRNRVTQHICRSSSVAAWAYGHSRSKCATSASVCHYPVQASFTRMTKYNWFASCGPYAERSVVNSAVKTDGPKTLFDYIQEYTRWLCSPESPWANIHKNDIEVIEDDKGHARGFILGPSVFQDVESYSGIYNFLVAGRMVRDHSSLFSRYGALREQLGLGKFEAFVMSGYYSWDSYRKCWTNGGLWQGSHTPLKEYGGTVKWIDGKSKWEKNLSIAKLRNKDYGPFPPISLNTEGWLDKDAISPTQVIQDIGKVKTRFSTISMFEPESILKVVKEIFG